MWKYPFEYALVKFEGNKFSGEIIPELLDIAQRGIVRFVDLVFIEKDADGSIRTLELNDFDEQAYKQFVPLGEHVQSLFSEEDLDHAADMLPANSSAALMLWENLWMSDLGQAVKDSAGLLIETGQIPYDIVDEVKKVLETG
jgi:hypothetical protein